MTIFVRIILLACAGASFAGTGASVAIRRFRTIEEMADDQGFTAIAGMLFVAGTLCAGLAGGFSAIPAILVPIAGAAYALSAHRLGIFRIETGTPRVRFETESELHT